MNDGSLAVHRISSKMYIQKGGGGLEGGWQVVCRGGGGGCVYEGLFYFRGKILNQNGFDIVLKMC